MRITALAMSLLCLALIMGFGGCANESSTSLVANDGAAPYYTVLADAQAAASEGQMIAVDFYTDW